MHNRRRPWEPYIDFGLVPLVIFFSLYTPYFISGYIYALDEGYHLACINDLLRGAVPYRETYMQHGPLLQFIPYWLMKLLTVHIGVLRGFYMFGNILSLVAAFILLRTLVSNPVLKYSALFFTLRFPMELRWIARWGGVRWVPGFAGLLFLYLWLRDGKRLHLFVAGALCGLGLLISQEIGLAVALSAAVAIFLKSLESKADGRIMKELFQNGFRFFIGFAVMVAPAYLYLVYVHAFGEYLKIAFVDTLFLLPKRMPYGEVIPVISGILYSPRRIEILKSRSFALYLMILALAIILVWTLFNYRKRSRYRMIFLLSLMAYAAVSLKGATRALHEAQFNVVLPTVFTTIAMFLESWLRPDANGNEPADASASESGAARRRRLKHLVVLMMIGVALILSGNPFTFFKENISALWWKMPSPLFGELDSTIMPRASGVKVPWPQAEDTNGVVGFLRDHTNESDPIYTFPYEGHIYFLADRRSASRFDLAIFATIRHEYMEEVISDLESKQPRFIVYNPNEYKILSIPNEQRISPIWAYIQRKYEFLAAYGDMRILVRKSPEETDQSAEKSAER